MLVFSTSEEVHGVENECRRAARVVANATAQNEAQAGEFAAESYTCTMSTSIAQVNE